MNFLSVRTLIHCDLQRTLLCQTEQNSGEPCLVGSGSHTTHTQKTHSYHHPRMNVLMVEFKCISSDLWPSDKTWVFLISCLESVKNVLSLQSEILSSYSSFPPVRLPADHATLPSQNDTIARNFVKTPSTSCRQRAKSSVNNKSPCIRTVEVFTLHWMNRAMETKGQESQNNLSIWWWQKTE